MKRAYLLAGGRSRRFGSDKARVEVEGVPQVTRLASQLKEVGWHVAIVAQSVLDYEDLGLDILADLQPDSGPLAGVIAALTDCHTAGSTHGLIANCDLVPWDWSWLDFMERRYQETKPSIVVFESTGFMPFPGLYGTSVLEHARSLWNAGGRSLRELHDRLRESIVAIAWPEDAIPQSFNTQDELRQILERGAPRGEIR
ncbi:MAG: molybdenum cofactor guanylyltransferase [Planctomycetota bacterium]|jgi:molybdopterin-guanine dinucleotide biosynthesis protein A